MESNKQIMTLANSIIGVSVLAMPFCFKECGMLLSLMLLLSSSILSRLTCYFLLKSAVLTRRRNYEFLAFHVYGPKGKLTVELFIIGFLLGTCVAFFVVMGDLSPQIVSSMIGAKRSNELRTTIMIVVALLVVLPLGLLRNVDSLEFICTASIGFYLCLVLKVIAESTPYLLAGDWVHEVRVWRPEGVLQCLPIFSMALFCQTQLFEVFGNLPNTPLDKMNEAVRTSINLCTVLYASVGCFGYIAFNSDSLTGNVLMSLEPTLSSEVIKLGFVLSVALSFPLVIFPCRASLYSLFYRSAQQHSIGHHDLSGSHIPDNEFKLLTVSIVLVSLLLGVLLPNIETVLGLVGSTIGVTVCITLPAMIMRVIARQEGDRLVSKITLTVGIIIMVLGTFSHMALIDKQTPVPEKPFAAGNLSPLKSPDTDSAVNAIPSPETVILSNVGVQQGEYKSPRLKTPGDLQRKPDDILKETDAKISPKVPQIGEINVRDPIDKTNEENKEKETVQNLKKMEDLKKVIDLNKQEQEKLLKEQHQILEGLKQHRREAEKLREKSEIERKKLAVAQNQSVEIKKENPPIIQEVSLLKPEPQKSFVKVPEPKLSPVETNNIPQPQPVIPAEKVVKLEVPAHPPILQSQAQIQPENIIKPGIPAQQGPPAVSVVEKKEDEIRAAQPAALPVPEEKNPSELKHLDVKSAVALLPLKSENLKEKEPVKEIDSQQETPGQVESLPKPVNQLQSSSPPLGNRAEEARLQPPLPLPPKSSDKLPLSGNEAKNTGGVDSDSIKLPPEPIPFVYQKKSALAEANQDSKILHRAKRESEVVCEGNDSSTKKRSSPSLLPDLQPLEVRIPEHVQPQIKDLVL